MYCLSLEIIAAGDSTGPRVLDSFALLQIELTLFKGVALAKTRDIHYY